MELVTSFSLLKVGSALALVVGLAFILVYLGKKTNFFKDQFGQSLGNGSPVRVVNSLVLDPKRRLVVVEWGREEHLLMLGNQGETYIKSKPLAQRQDMPLPRKDNQ
jgi:flagellar biogenesis protein FliO